MGLPDVFKTMSIGTSESTAADFDGERVNKKEGQRDSVLSLKLEKLAWSIGAVATVMAFACLVGLIIRLLITT